MSYANPLMVLQWDGKNPCKIFFFQLNSHHIIEDVDSRCDLHNLSYSAPEINKLPSFSHSSLMYSVLSGLPGENQIGDNLITVHISDSVHEIRFRIKCVTVNFGSQWILTAQVWQTHVKVQRFLYLWDRDKRQRASPHTVSNYTLETSPHKNAAHDYQYL